MAYIRVQVPDDSCLGCTIRTSYTVDRKVYWFCPVLAIDMAKVDAPRLCGKLEMK